MKEYTGYEIWKKIHFSNPHEHDFTMAKFVRVEDLEDFVKRKE